MVTKCFLCKRNAKQNPGFGCFRFPKDEDRCALWFKAINATRLPKHTAKFCYQNLTLCSEHFNADNIKRNKQKKRIHPDAIPILHCEPPQSEIKQEKVDHFRTEPEVKVETNMLDPMEIKLEAIKIEPQEEAQIIEKNDDSMSNCSLNEISKQEGSGIKLEESEAIDGGMNDVDVKWAIENDELIIKEEEDIEDEELGDSKQKFSGDKFSCEQCEYKTTQKNYLKYHLKQHDNSMTMIKCTVCEYKTVYKKKLIATLHNIIRSYKCDQCDYIMGCKRNLTRHLLVHTNSDEVDADV